VHIATHGYFMPMTCGVSEADLRDASLQSGLALAGANACQGPTAGTDRTDDGLLTALEAASLDLYGTELAVLSACDTAVGATGIHDAFLGREIGRADGVHGLRRALVLAGARTQMVSLWTVGDTTTRKLMTAYYRKIASGKGRSLALREVQMELLKTEGASHPRHWASFIVSGDHTPLVASDVLVRGR
jgi:CHAT domain-containing protein